MKKLALIAMTATLSACSMLPNQKTVSGTYQGDLPCADCSKIKAELILNVDNSYQYNTIYVKNDKEHSYADKGKFSWDSKNRDLIRLEKESGNLAIKVTDSYAEICDIEGKCTNKADYQLKKVK